MGLGSMRWRRSAAAGLASAVLATAGVGAVSPAQAAATIPLSNASTAASVTVTLLTGDRVIVPAGGGTQQSVSVIPTPSGDGSPAMVRSFTIGGDVYVVPADAVPYYGRQLDPSLFNVTDLAVRQRSGVPVTATVTWQPGATRRNIPGVSGSASIGQAAAAFGPALAAQAAADEASGTTGGALFSGVDRISVAGASAATATDSSFTMHTVTIRSRDLRNSPVGFNGLATLQNLDNRDTFQASAAFYKGSVSFSVPAGHYNVIVSSRTFDSHGNYVGDALVFNPELTVDQDVNLTMDAKLATNRVWIPSTPKPTTYEQLQVKYARITPLGQEDVYAQMLSGGSPVLYVSPTRPEQVSIGSLHYYSYFRLDAPAGADPSYTYDLNFPADGAVPASSTPDVDPASLATVDASYHSDVPDRVGFEYRDSFFPWEGLSVRYTPADNLVAPLRRTEYVSAVPDLGWQHTLWASGAEYNMITLAPKAIYQRGQSASEEFQRAPLHPDVLETATVSEGCRACRQGNQLRFRLSPWSANQPGTAVTQLSNGGTMSTSAQLSLTQNGIPVGTTSTVNDGRFTVADQPSLYQLRLDATKVAPWSTTTAISHTTWSFTSAPGAGAIPSERTCSDGTQNCAFLPLLFLEYVAPLDLLNTVQTVGPVSLDVTVRHQLFQAPPQGADLTFAVSFDDGASWTPATVTARGGGVFRVSYDQPNASATGGFVSFRATAAAATGESIDQTLIRAYQLRPADPANPAPPPAAPTTAQACAPLPGTNAHCLAIVNTADNSASSGAGGSAGRTEQGQPQGYGPVDLDSAYRLPVDGGAGQTIGIVDAYDNPNVESDLAAYRAQYGLPPCTTANGCFQKVNQNGKAAPLPYPEPGWGLESSLDVDMVSAACPNCRILLVEADSSSLADLGEAVDAAVRLGADVVSNSYGTAGEPANETTFEAHYRHPGHPIVVSSGDYGYNASYPAVSANVTSVGGTTLTRATNDRGWAETAWSGTGGGCSAYIAKPKWQTDPHCPTRMMNDIAAVADPHTGVAVYDTFAQPGWVVVGGTSAGAPIIAAAYALAGDAAADHDASGLYQHAADLNDIVGGNNATPSFDCRGDYICTAVPGYDGPTGLGTPNGVAAFRTN